MSTFGDFFAQPPAVCTVCWSYWDRPFFISSVQSCQLGHASKIISLWLLQMARVSLVRLFYVLFWSCWVFTTPPRWAVLVLGPSQKPLNVPDTSPCTAAAAKCESGAAIKSNKKQPILHSGLAGLAPSLPISHLLILRDQAAIFMDIRWKLMRL